MLTKTTFFSGLSNNKTKDNTDATNHLLQPSKTPSRIFGPLIAYMNPTNTANNTSNNLQKLSPDDTLHTPKKPIIRPEENPYYHHKNSIPDLQNVETFVTTPKPKLTKYKNKAAVNQQKRPLYETNPHEELLHILGQHPQLANIPHGSILEVHNIPPNHPAFLDHILQGLHQATTYNDNLTIYPGGS